MKGNTHVFPIENITRQKPKYALKRLASGRNAKRNSQQEENQTQFIDFRHLTGVHLEKASAESWRLNN